MVDDLGVFQVTIEVLLLLILAHPQNSQKSLLRNIDLANPLHPLLAFFLLLQQLAFA